MWTDTQIAYLAGIIDGEGTIYVQVRKRGECFDYFPRFQVVNTDRGLMEWIHSTFGGILVQKDRSKHSKKWRLQYQWFTSRGVMDDLLKKVIPYLICKKPHALAMLEFRKTFWNKKSHKVSEETLSIRTEIFHRLKSLNKRGVH